MGWSFLRSDHQHGQHREFTGRDYRNADSIRSEQDVAEPEPAGARSQSSSDRGFVQISDFELATVAPPTEPAGTDFNYDSRTNDFAAVNAYYHCDRFFRLVEELGFPIRSYFDGTTFPVPVDHRGSLSVRRMGNERKCVLHRRRRWHR